MDHALWLILFCLCVIVLLVFWMPVGLSVYFHSHDGNDQLKIEGRLLWGLVHYHLDVPVIYWNICRPWALKSGVAAGGAPTKPRAGRLSHYLDIVKDVSMLLDDYRYFIREIRSSAECVEFTLTTELGCSDPADTAVTYGLLWSLQNFILREFGRHVHCKGHPHLKVVPHFEKPVWDCVFHCIFHLRAGDIIIAGLKTLIKGR